MYLELSTPLMRYGCKINYHILSNKCQLSQYPQKAYAAALVTQLEMPITHYDISCESIYYTSMFTP